MTVSLSQVGALLAQHLGLEVSSIGLGTVAAAIGARASALRIDVDEYAAIPARDPRELAALVDEIVVPESWFFRDRVPFTHLASYAAEKVRAGRRPFRVLSAPCATGEEPYSVVMAMRDAGLSAADISVDAVDVSPPLLESARRATYRPVSFRGIELGFRERYFVAAGLPSDPGGQTWTLSPEIRASVAFQICNLVSPAALHASRPYDAILCRNLLIYLTADARRAVLSRFIELLGDGGILVVGHAETLELIDPRFRALPFAGAFTYTVRRSTDRAITQPVVEKPTRKIEPLRKPVDLVEQATTHADRGELTKAAELVEQHLATSGADGKAWALLATVKQASGDLARAEECFSRALYCDPGMYNALVSLALLLERRGETAGAANLRRRAERARAREQP